MWHSTDIYFSVSVCFIGPRERCHFCSNVSIHSFCFCFFPIPDTFFDLLVHFPVEGAPLLSQCPVVNFPTISNLQAVLLSWNSQEYLQNIICKKKTFFSMFCSQMFSELRYLFNLNSTVLCHSGNSLILRLTINNSILFINYVFQWMIY